MDAAFIVQVLLPYLVGLYIIDSISYIGKHHRLFVSPFGDSFKMRCGGFRLAGLSPLCQAIDAHLLPIFITRKGIYLPVTSDVDGQRIYLRDDLCFLPYGELHSVEAAGKSVRLNGSISLDTPSPIVSRIIAGRLADLRNAEGPERENTYGVMRDEMTDTEKLTRMRADSSRPLGAIGLGCSTLFLAVFVLLPPAAYRFVDVEVSLLLFFMAPVYCAIVGSTYIFHRRCFPSMGQERMYLLLTIILLPVSAIHVVSRITRGMYAGYDFLAVAAVFLPKDTIRAVLRKELEITRIARTDDLPSDLREYWSEREGILHRLVKAAGFSLEEICREPARKDRFAKAYCPLCDTEYRFGFDSCSDCRVDLREFQGARYREDVSA